MRTIYVSPDKCIAMWDILSEIFKRLGSLPEGKTPTELLNVKPEELLEYAKTVAENDILWAQLPEVIKPTQDEVDEITSLLKCLFSTGSDDKAPNINETKIVSGFTAGQSKDDLRSCLRETIDSCQL